MKKHEAKFTIEGEHIKFNLIDFITEHVPDELLPIVALELSLHDTIIEHVANQILDGFTGDGACGAEVYSLDGAGDSMSPLQQARRRIAKMAGDVAAKEIERLSANLVRAEKKICEMHEWSRF